MVNRKMVNNMKSYIQPIIDIQSIAPLSLMVGQSNHIVTSTQGIHSNGLGTQYTNAI